MANKTTETKDRMTESQIKHALVDIEIDIDAKIADEIQVIKTEYNDAIRDYKTLRNDQIRAVRKTRTQTIKNARNQLLNAEV